MRGPGFREAGDVRRTWRCPACQRERKFSGQVTAARCDCPSAAWMQIVKERILIPRPLQRPSDIERRPSEFGIEPAPAPPARATATLIQPAISDDQITVTAPNVESDSLETKHDQAKTDQAVVSPEPEIDDWDREIV